MEQTVPPIIHVRIWIRMLFLIRIALHHNTNPHKISPTIFLSHSSARKRMHENINHRSSFSLSFLVQYLFCAVYFWSAIGTCSGVSVESNKIRSIGLCTGYTCTWHLFSFQRLLKDSNSLKDWLTVWTEPAAFYPMSRTSVFYKARYILSEMFCFLK